ncbi:hypothetical protein BH18THE2_BH18THE2_14760 [soil metagenome]
MGYHNVVAYSQTYMGGASVPVYLSERNVSSFLSILYCIKYRSISSCYEKRKNSRWFRYLTYIFFLLLAIVSVVVAPVMNPTSVVLMVSYFEILNPLQCMLIDIPYHLSLSKPARH